MRKHDPGPSNERDLPHTTTKRPQQGTMVTKTTPTRRRFSVPPARTPPHAGSASESNTQSPKDHSKPRSPQLVLPTGTHTPHVKTRPKNPVSELQPNNPWKTKSKPPASARVTQRTMPTKQQSEGSQHTMGPTTVRTVPNVAPLL
jgi:hypothetical protein